MWTDWSWLDAAVLLLQAAAALQCFPEGAPSPQLTHTEDGLHSEEATPGPRQEEGHMSPFFHINEEEEVPQFFNSCVF